MVGTPGFEPGISCTPIRQPSSTAFTQFLPFVALTRFWGVCFRSQRLRLARLMGEFPDGFLTVVAATGCAARFFSNGFRAAIAPLVVRVGFDEPREATPPTTTLCCGFHSKAVVTALPAFSIWFRYQTVSGKKPRRIVAKVEHHCGELFQRVVS